MPEEKPVTGSNEHFAEIEKQLAKLMDIETRLAAVSDSYHALVAETARLNSQLTGLQGTVSTVQTTVSNLQAEVQKSKPLSTQVLG